MSSFPHYRQQDQMDCGPTCIKMVAKHYGKNINIDALRYAAGIGREGVNLLGISDAGESLGFRTRGVQLSFRQFFAIVGTSQIGVRSRRNNLSGSLILQNGS